MRPIIVRCTDRHTFETVNGPMTTVKLEPDAAFDDNEGSLTVYVHDDADHAAYQVGVRFRLIPEAL